MSSASTGSAPATNLRALLRPVLRQHRRTLIWATGLNAFHGIAIAFQALIPKYIIDDVALASGLDRSTRLLRLAALIGAFLVTTLIGRMLVWHLSYRLFSRVREELIFGLRRLFFVHVNHLCLRFHALRHSGELFNYLFGSPVAQLSAYFNHFATSVPGALFTLAWTAAWVSVWDLPMTAVLLGSVVAATLIMQRTQNRVQQLHTDYQHSESQISGRVADVLRGTRDIKLLAVERFMTERFAAQARELGRRLYRRDIETHQQTMKYEGSSYLFFALLAVVGVFRYLDGDITIGEFQAYLTAFLTLQGPLGSLFGFYVQRGAARASLERLDEVFQTRSSTPDPGPDAEACPSTGTLQLRGVTFGYRPDEPVLRDVDLEIPYGQHVAIVGPSGAGKSTLIQLLMRLYDPDAGQICLDGVDLRRCRGTNLRGLFGVVPQDPFIFRTTVRENLEVARPHATDEELVHALVRARAWSFVRTLEGGLDAPIGEGGASLSGGQRQRLAIARALLRDPAFLVLDEATSALDTVGEHAVQAALEQAWEGKTTLVIAHRLATVQSCDRIVVMEHGAVVQDGTFEELAAQPGLFRDLVRTQELSTADERVDESLATDDPLPRAAG